MNGVLYLVPLFLCWGSFLNVVGYRLIRNQPFTGRSFCTSCNTPLAWYDLIPLASWILLRGRSRCCNQPISLLYPFIELLTVVLLCALVYCTPTYYLPMYGLFFSTLIVTVRTDLEHMLISRFVSLYLVPLGFIASMCDLLPLSLTESVFGALAGYGFLTGLSFVFTRVTGREGIGEGDIDLIAYIGSFTGLLGVWTTLVVGSLLGSLIGATYLVLTKQSTQVHIPFGPFLVAGACTFVLMHHHITTLINYSLTL